MFPTNPLSCIHAALQRHLRLDLLALHRNNGARSRHADPRRRRAAANGAHAARRRDQRLTGAAIAEPDRHLGVRGGRIRVDAAGGAAVAVVPAGGLRHPRQRRVRQLLGQHPQGRRLPHLLHPVHVPQRLRGLDSEARLPTSRGAGARAAGDGAAGVWGCGALNGFRGGVDISGSSGGGGGITGTVYMWEWQVFLHWGIGLVAYGGVVLFDTHILVERVMGRNGGDTPGFGFVV